MDAFIANFWVFAGFAGFFLGFWVGWSASFVKGGDNFAYHFERAEGLTRENHRLMEQIERQAQIIKELKSYMPARDPLAWDDDVSW